MGAFNPSAFNPAAFYAEVEAPPRTYPLAGMTQAFPGNASQSFPGDADQQFPLGGQA